MSGHPSFGWWQVLRLALVQACLGSVVVITTSTLNRIMVVELAFPALLPGALVAWHYAVQMVRPRMGYGADIAPFLLHAEATAMRATCVQMSYAVERIRAWPQPVALTRLDLSGNCIGDAGAAALAAHVQVCFSFCDFVWCMLVWVPQCALAGQDGVSFRFTMPSSH